MDIIGEAEKLGDYVLNVVQAVIEKNDYREIAIFKSGVTL